ncbi:hypothetical protein [Calothrix sp. PCC 7507]|uniref:hypothetical protein n=1 Tax=Calothrix sp. PCC 7507 TaxID=99598 RepID=UPI00029EF6C2|nr:hypothetical protein [Calothrix sp. PCC 7507]AFY36438.1 hypothetical protein Cal7507_6142 [Calothrix sp. PCC 7507]
MSPVTQTSSSHPELNLFLFSIPQSLLLQIGTASILLLLTTAQATTRAMEAVGQASEELFRGDRLPILNFPDDQESSNS